jgi:hypothetical protein
MSTKKYQILEERTGKTIDFYIRPSAHQYPTNCSLVLIDYTNAYAVPLAVQKTFVSLETARKQWKVIVESRGWAYNGVKEISDDRIEAVERFA